MNVGAAAAAAAGRTNGIDIAADDSDLDSRPGRGKERGLDSSLQKHAPETKNLEASNYRIFRRKLETYEKMCLRRGTTCAIEAAFGIFAQLQDTHWEITETMDLDDLDARHFACLKDVLDPLFKYGEEIEVPKRCQEFFYQFSRKKNETMQEYIARHKQERQRLRECKIDIPEVLAGWHLLARSAIPSWTEVQVRTVCAGNMDCGKIEKALVQIFGADHRPHVRDVARSQKIPGSSQEEGFAAEAFSLENGDEYDENEGWYEEDELQQWYQDDDCYYEDEEWYDDDAYYGEEGDEEIDEEMEEAYLGYLEARQKMRDISNSRGFYPVFAMIPEERRRPPKGKGRGNQEEVEEEVKVKAKVKEEEKVRTRRDLVQRKRLEDNPLRRRIIETFPGRHLRLPHLQLQVRLHLEVLPHMGQGSKG